MASFKVLAGTGELRCSSGTSAKTSAPEEGGMLAELAGSSEDEPPTLRFLASGLLTLASAALPRRASSLLSVEKALSRHTS